MPDSTPPFDRPPRPPPPPPPGGGGTRSRTPPRRTKLPPPEDGLALLDERLRRLPVVFRHPAARVVPRLEVERVLERAALGGVEVPLHVAVRDPRAAGEPGRQPERLLLHPPP